MSFCISDHLGWWDEYKEHENSTKQVEHARTLSENLWTNTYWYVPFHLWPQNYLCIYVVDIITGEDNAERFQAPSDSKHKEKFCIENLRFKILENLCFKILENLHFKILETNLS